ncbi:glycosyltransferase family 2 protein [Candidatus Roizmanbacteria bacterium]|nr:glycosyltransferase family 2 protein [Candidatus Roizmanbacteria bacterium]
MDDKLAVIVVTINYSVLSDFFDSLKKQKNRSFHLYLTDISPKKKELAPDGFEYTVIPAENRGYSYAMNIALRAAIKKGFRYFCVVNDDTFFKEDFVDRVLQSVKNHPRSIIGGKIYYAPGYEYHKDRYKNEELGRVIWSAGGYVDWDHALTFHRGVDEVDHGQYDTVSEVTYVTGAFIAFDGRVVETAGFWDESYFLFYEDADYMERAKRRGVKLIFDPSMVIWHKVSQSTGGSGSPLHQKYQARNRVKFGLRYAPWKTKLHLIKNYFVEKLKK